MAVRVDLNISLDGFATTTDQTADDPMGEDWGRLTAAYAATRTFRERVLHDPSGEGTTEVDDEYAAAYFEGIGAEIMGAGMFGLHANPDDSDWRGWWGDEPPFRVPVFVLTQHDRRRRAGHPDRRRRGRRAGLPQGRPRRPAARGNRAHHARPRGPGGSPGEAGPLRTRRGTVRSRGRPG